MRTVYLRHRNISLCVIHKKDLCLSSGFNGLMMMMMMMIIIFVKALLEPRESMLRSEFYILRNFATSASLRASTKKFVLAVKNILFLYKRCLACIVDWQTETRQTDIPN
jgi:hypothetical protein